MCSCVRVCARVPWGSVPRYVGMGLVRSGSQSHVTFGKSRHFLSPHPLLGGGEGSAENLQARDNQG